MKNILILLFILLSACATYKITETKTEDILKGCIITTPFYSPKGATEFCMVCDTTAHEFRKIAIEHAYKLGNK